MPEPDLAKPQPRVGLFVTCLAELFRPSVGFAAIRLLEDAGCTVEGPMAQIRCGQPGRTGAGDLMTMNTIGERQ